MHPNEAVIRAFYDSFAKRDAVGMAACYHRDVVFSDPVFQNLPGDSARAMWAMLCARGHDLAIRYTNAQADDQRGSAHWEATYSFSQTGRLVHNIIDATFEFKDGKIIRHTDTFNLWRWAGMALGPKGRFLGWLPPFQAAIRKNAMAGLKAFMQKQAAVKS
jgi:ketosteroid isomerase-like protein